MNWNKILMYTCFIYFGISFEFVYIQLLPLFNNTANYALPPPPFVYDTIYKTSPSYVYYIVIVTFLGSIVSLLAGIRLYQIDNKSTKTNINNKWINNITNEFDKKVIQIIKENNNIITQSQLVKESNMTKVKIHRIIQKLEKIQIIEKTKFGQTNKIKIINKSK